MKKNKKLSFLVGLRAPIALTLALTILGPAVLTSCSHRSVNPPAMQSREREVADSNIDQLIEEFRTYYESTLSLKRREEIKTVQENLLKYLIEASGGDDAHKIRVYKQGNAYLNKIYPRLMANIKNEKNGVNEFYEIKRAPIWTLKEEIRFLNAEADALPKAQIQIDMAQSLALFSRIYKTMMVDVDTKTLARDKYSLFVRSLSGEKFNLFPTFQELEGVIEQSGSDEKRIVKLVNLVETRLNAHELKIRNIGSEIASSGQVNMNDRQVKLVIKFMDYYFNHMSDDVVKTILSEILSSEVKLTQEEILKIIFKNTGPGLGKVLQQIGKEQAFGGPLSMLVELLESEGKEVPLHLVKEVVAKDNGGFEVRSVDKKLGTGTIAQVNKGTMWVDNQEKEVALRLKKPGVEARCKEDIKILRQFVPDNEALFAAEGVEDLKILETLIDSVEKFLDEELDLNEAVVKQKKAYDIYNRALKVSSSGQFDMLEIRVPEVYIPPRGSSNLHVQEFAGGGVKFAALKESDTKKIVAREMVRMWFEETLFRSGFFNADLHQGNFKVTLIEENKKIKIVLYDFGLSTTLSKEEQRAFMLLGAGAFLKSPDTLVDGIMASMNSKDKSLKVKLKADIMNEMRVAPNKKAEEWVVWCVQKNYFVSENLGAFARGSMLVKQLPESIGEGELFKDTIAKTAVSNLFHAIADRDYKYPLKKIDMVKLGAVQVKNMCIDLIKKFFK